MALVENGGQELRVPSLLSFCPRDPSVMWNVIEDTLDRQRILRGICGLHSINLVVRWAWLQLVSHFGDTS